MLEKKWRGRGVMGGEEREERERQKGKERKKG